jgi:hypothetical protein
MELDREEDGRWIADVPELNVFFTAPLGELPADAANPVFAVAV